MLNLLILSFRLPRLRDWSITFFHSWQRARIPGKCWFFDITALGLGHECFWKSGDIWKARYNFKIHSDAIDFTIFHENSFKSQLIIQICWKQTFWLSFKNKLSKSFKNKFDRVLRISLTNFCPDVGRGFDR